MSKHHAVVVDPTAPGRFKIAEVESPAATSHEALVRVAAVSLNRGEIRMAADKPLGSRIGWDLAGIVERAAADGSGNGRSADKRFIRACGNIAGGRAHGALCD